MLQLKPGCKPRCQETETWELQRQTLKVRYMYTSKPEHVSCYPWSKARLGCPAKYLCLLSSSDAVSAGLKSIWVRVLKSAQNECFVHVKV